MGRPNNSHSLEQTRAPLAAQPARVKVRELLAVSGLVVLADLTIYRGYGFAGLAAFFIAAPLLLWGAPRRRGAAALGAIVMMLLVLAAALAWCGTGGQVANRGGTGRGAGHGSRRHDSFCRRCLSVCIFHARHRRRRFDKIFAVARSRHGFYSQGDVAESRVAARSRAGLRHTVYNVLQSRFLLTRVSWLK